ncbi:MAG: prepilin-type N-terminal cleavage/methylation domain-containing protein [Elusimicrobia bacterium]|nr:prepilin-type N-terminal cleavage/methylation domain-containing protein [Elusimicrobiota bacterium]
MKNTNMARQEHGFTIVELMVVVFIIGLLAVISIPKFADLVKESNEGSTKGNLGAIRAAMSVYYGDTYGAYPQQIADLTIGGKYLGFTVPAAKTPYYHDNSAAEHDASSVNDMGGWFFDNVPSDQNYGTVLVNCTHTDSSGSTWDAY